MAPTLRLHEIHGSPNNLRARLALRYKKLPFESVPISLTDFPGDRSSLVALSRQPKTPVLEHGQTVVFDSWGILRYLEANFKDTPALFSADYGEMNAIEEWELWARTKLEEPINTVFGEVMSPKPDLGACRAASAQLHELTTRIETALASSPYVLRNTLSAADLACAPIVGLGCIPPGVDAGGPIGAFFQANLDVGPGRDRTRDWVRRITAMDAAG